MKYIERKNKIINDRYTEYVYESFDIQNKDETSVKIPINFSECKKIEWNIGVIYGGSGTGKTTLLKEFGNLTNCYFDKHKPLISNFDWLEPKDATFLLSAMGLASVPTWLRPYDLLSNGEQYRASLAYKVGKASNNDVILIDEYTSVVDRDVAKAMSNALQKYIRNNKKRIILASCHFDIMEWLQPDWTYSPLKGRLEIASCRRHRPKIELQIFRSRYETWNIFKQHHYLSQELNKAAKCFIVLFNDKPVAFMAILPMPSGTIQNAFRVSRLVVLPDFQGLGIGIKLLNTFGSMYKKDNKTLYIKTSNPSLFKGMIRNKKYWFLTNENNNIDQIKKTNKKLLDDGKDNGLKLRKESITKSYKYIGEQFKDDISVLTFNADAYKEVAQNQISLF
ncbi:MAG: putative replication origin-binding protein [Prokaryotic dsDNA virus sp.]|nr:MAG: putative replication origin-binding protein [Prokaryotic dsDNA virus sp.]|tara:strand:+ start:12650 stop:13828 length:1179 start_codon:yes stop_codon:yes gene_type:complete